MAAVHFYLKRSKGAESHIVLSFIYQKRGKPFRFYTNLYSPPDYWDSKKERVSPPTKKRFDQAVEINNTLDKLRSGVDRLKLRFEDERKILTDEILKNELTALRNLEKPKSGQQTFMEYFEQFVKSKTSVPNYVKNSAKGYITILGHVKKFINSTGQKFDFEDITKNSLNDFVSYLKTKNFQPNNIQRLASSLKTVLRSADQDEVSPNFKFKNEWLSVPKVETDAIRLTTKEIESITNFDLSNKPRLDRIRDLFLIGCHTGLRFSDYSNLSVKNFITMEDGTLELHIRAQKTQGIICYPLFPEAETILKKYNFNPPSGISNTKMNKYLKELGKLVGIDAPVTFTKYYGGKKNVETYPKWEKISTHTARRTFATNAMEGKMPVELIMHMTGHKAHKDFLRYIRFSDYEKNVQIMNHPYFKKSHLESKTGDKYTGNDFF